MPAYNAASTIGSAIQSVLDQTFADWELIVVDDCSTDPTLSVVRQFDDPRIVLISLPENVRCAAARNAGLARARGRWFGGLDADDAWDSRRLEALMKNAGATSFVSDITISARSDDAGNLVPYKTPGDPSECAVERLADYKQYFNSPGHKFGIFPLEQFRQSVGGFPEEGSGGEWAFAYAKWFAAGFDGVLLLWPGCYYRVGGAHYSSRLRAIEEQLSVDRYLSEVDWFPHDIRSVIATGLIHIRRRLLVAALRERNWRAFLSYAGRHPQDALHLPHSALRFAVRRWKDRYRGQAAH